MTNKISRWDWYGKSGLDELTKFDDRNQGHHQPAGEDEEDVQEMLKRHLKIYNADHDDKEEDDTIISSIDRSDKDWVPYEEDMTKSNANELEKSVSPTTPSFGRGRGWKLQERRKKFKVWRPHEYVARSIRTSERQEDDEDKKNQITQ